MSRSFLCKQSDRPPVTEAARPGGWALTSQTVGSWVWIPPKIWMFVRVFLCCVFLCRYRPCDGLITRPRSPTIFLNSLRNLPYARRPRSFKNCTATEKESLTDQNGVFLHFIYHACYASSTSHPRRLDYPNNIWWTVQTMQLLIVQFSPASCHFILHTSKFYFPWLRSLKRIRPCPRPSETSPNTLVSSCGEVNHRVGGPSLVGCPWLFIQYILSYPSHLEAFLSIRNLSMRHAVVTRDLLNTGNINDKISNGRHMATALQITHLVYRQLGVSKGRAVSNTRVFFL
jgi:hypothetical protein